MLEASWLNVGSLALGLIAWGIPIISLIQYKQGHLKKCVICSMVSLSACATSLCMQILYTGHLVKINDWTALLDTHWAVVFVSLTLLVITVIINAITLILHFKNTKF